VQSRPAARIGLTGGIGSGKSTVAAALVSLGATLVDTDAIAHQLTAPGGGAMPALRDAFGPEIQDTHGALDRGRMRALVFSDSGAKRSLEAILHPMIGRVAQEQAAAAPGCVVYDVPLLTESAHWRARCDRILVVDCTEATQVARVTARSGWAEAQVRHVIAQQASRPARRRIADAVIYNDGLALEALQDEVAALWQQWRPWSPQGMAEAL
jgi:dephospho-CoA kinase